MIQEWGICYECAGNGKELEESGCPAIGKCVNVGL